ncbi:MAG TPA: NUDIX domain-containing protein [Thermoplasmata archaeon]|nr:NUDIX domain-containing protein [Thermoplasmata archaeon]
MQLTGLPLRAGTALGRVVVDRGDRAVVAAPPGASVDAPSEAGAILCSDSASGPWTRPDSKWAGYILGLQRTVSTLVAPTVGGLPCDVFRDADRVRVNGSTGIVELEGVREIRVVTSFLERADGRILLLRRSSAVGSYQGRWAGVSGFLEDPTAEEQARREILEETGVGSSELDLRASGRTVYARDGDRIFSIDPFRFRVADPVIRLDWEHTEFAWIAPDELGRFPTVPQLDRAWRAVAGTTERADRPNP